MSEVKLRAWDSDNNKMVYLSLGNDDEGLFICNQVLPAYKDVMLCSGIEDKNGKEVYDSDIIKTPAGIGYVETGKGVVWLHWNKKDSTTLYDCKTEHLEIIGNIHENPELLK